MQSAREAGVRAAWKAERSLVASGQPGTRNWSRSERAELLSSGKVKGYEGHHINTVKGNPLEMARNPKNIQFVTRAEHVQIHREAGGFRVPITGRPMLARSVGGLSWLTLGTGILSGRIRTNNLDNFVSDMVGLDSQEDIRNYYIQLCGVPRPCA